jgi:hypothetical protein
MWGVIFVNSEDLAMPIRQLLLGFVLAASAATSSAAPAVALEPSQDFSKESRTELLVPQTSSAEKSKEVTEPQLEQPARDQSVTAPAVQPALQFSQVQVVSGPETIIATPEFSRPQTPQPEPSQEKVKPGQSISVPETPVATTESATETQAPKPPPEPSQVTLEPRADNIVRVRRLQKRKASSLRPQNNIVPFKERRLEPTRATFSEQRLHFSQTRLRKFQVQGAPPATPQPKPHGARASSATQPPAKGTLGFGVTLANRVTTLETSLSLERDNSSLSFNVQQPSDGETSLDIEAKLPVSKAVSLLIKGEDITNNFALSTQIEAQLSESLKASLTAKNITKDFNVDVAATWQATKTTTLEVAFANLLTETEVNLSATQKLGSFEVQAAVANVARPSLTKVNAGLSLELSPQFKLEFNANDIFGNVDKPSYEGKASYNFSFRL